MRLDNIRKEIHGDRARLSATLTWEDCPRPVREIYYEVDKRYGDDLAEDPNAFVTAAIMPAVRHGESRLAVEGKVCPGLRNGLTSAAMVVRRWSGLTDGGLPKLEPSEGFTASVPSQISRTACFFSGGIDSMCTLRCNRLDYPRDHPFSIRDALVVFGFGLGYSASEESWHRALFDDLVHRLSNVTADADATLIPVYTNIKHIDEDWDFWERHFHGAALVSCAHALSHRISTVLIGSTFRIDHLEPWGSHPLLDSYYGSAALRVIHDGAHLHREAKTKIISDWPVALNNLHVCLDPNAARDQEQINCGKCEKCIRTMLTLMLHGKLDQCQSFPANDVSQDLLASVKFRKSWQPLYYGKKIPRLRELGRHDLVATIHAKTKDYHEWMYGGWRSVIRRWDRQYTGGLLTRTIRKFR